MDTFRWLYKKSVAEVKLKPEPVAAEDPSCFVGLLYEDVCGFKGECPMQGAQPDVWDLVFLLRYVSLGQ